MSPDKVHFTKMLYSNLHLCTCRSICNTQVCLVRKFKDSFNEITCTKIEIKSLFMIKIKILPTRFYEPK